MEAADALAKAGLKPIQPFAADTNALTSSDAYATGIAALAVNDARHALEWADLIYAMDLNGMNSSITPVSSVVQRERPFKWLNWEAGRVRDMIKGSYLFDDDPHRIIQDPESLRASSIRQASAWQGWGALRDAVVLQMNSSDHNPAVRTDLSPQDSWELATPQMMKFYVKGGPYSNGKHGYIVSNANWDPYPDGQRTGIVRDRLGEHGRGRVAAHRSLQQSVLHDDRSGEGAAPAAGRRIRALSGQRRRLHAGRSAAGDAEA